MAPGSAAAPGERLSPQRQAAESAASLLRVEALAECDDRWKLRAQGWQRELEAAHEKQAELAARCAQLQQLLQQQQLQLRRGEEELQLLRDQSIGKEQEHGGELHAMQEELQRADEVARGHAQREQELGARLSDALQELQAAQAEAAGLRREKQELGASLRAARAELADSKQALQGCEERLRGEAEQAAAVEGVMRVWTADRAPSASGGGEGAAPGPEPTGGARRRPLLQMLQQQLSHLRAEQQKGQAAAAAAERKARSAAREAEGLRAQLEAARAESERDRARAGESEAACEAALREREAERRDEQEVRRGLQREAAAAAAELEALKSSVETYRRQAERVPKLRREIDALQGRVDEAGRQRRAACAERDSLAQALRAAEVMLLQQQQQQQQQQARPATPPAASAPGSFLRSPPRAALSGPPLPHPHPGRWGGAEEDLRACCAALTDEVAALRELHADADDHRGRRRSSCRHKQR